MLARLGSFPSRKLIVLVASSLQVPAFLASSARLMSLRTEIDIASPMHTLPPPYRPFVERQKLYSLLPVCVPRVYPSVRILGNYLDRCGRTSQLHSAFLVKTLRGSSLYKLIRVVCRALPGLCRCDSRYLPRYGSFWWSGRKVLSFLRSAYCRRRLSSVRLQCRSGAVRCRARNTKILSTFRSATHGSKFTGQPGAFSPSTNRIRPKRPLVIWSLAKSGRCSSPTAWETATSRKLPSS